MNIWLAVALVVLAGSLCAAKGGQNAPAQQGQEQNAPPDQQQPQASSSAAVQSVTGCLVRSDSGYSLKTDTDTVPIETDKDLSQYVGKQIIVTGILEHHNATSSKSNGTVAITDLRLRVVATVIGDCNSNPK